MQHHIATSQGSLIRGIIALIIGGLAVFMPNITFRHHRAIFNLDRYPMTDMTDLGRNRTLYGMEIKQKNNHLQGIT